MGTSKSSQRAEAELFALLQRLAPPVRRHVIGHLSQSQRLALERWMLARTRGSRDGRKARSLRPRSGTSARSSSVCRKLSDSNLPKSGSRGVHFRSKSGRISYCASVSAGQLRLDSAYVPDVGRARHFHRVLLAIQARLQTPESDVSMEAAERAFRVALAEEPQRHGIETADLDLRFSVVVPSRYWVGTSLRTPQFMAASDLESGILAWKELSSARARIVTGGNRFSIFKYHSPYDLDNAWHKIKASYIEACAKTGQNPDRVASRLNDLEAKHGGCRRRMSSLWDERRARKGGGTYEPGNRDFERQLGQLLGSERTSQMER